MNSTNQSSTATHKLSDLARLQQMRRALRTSLTRIWETRRVPLCPPAFAAITDGVALEIPECADGKSLVVFLPPDFESSLEALVNLAPVVRTHPDISLTSQTAYLSWSLPSVGNALPLTLWIQYEDIDKAFAEMPAATVVPSLPLVFVAADSVVVGRLTLDDILRHRCHAAMLACEQPPTGFTQQELQKAEEKAKLYSERPWLLMRYELRNGDRRLAVNYAPVRRMRAATSQD